MLFSIVEPAASMPSTKMPVERFDSATHVSIRVYGPLIVMPKARPKATRHPLTTISAPSVTIVPLTDS